MSKIVIIGGGASGLVASISLAKNHDVILLEKNSDVGKKILITGNGRCNYFNDDMSLDHFYSNSLNDISEIINDKNIEKLQNFFNKIGLIPKIKNGYYYPYSNQAVSIQNILKIEAINSGVKIINDFNVTKIEKDNKFYIYDNDEKIVCDKLVLATGSKSYSKTGSDGFSYNILKQFNLNIIKPLPALVPLEGNLSFMKKWSGIRCDAKLELYENDVLIKKENGEILLTDYGISGICTFNISNHVVRGLDENKNEKIIINFVDMLNIDSKANFILYLDDRDKLLKNRKVCELFDSIVNYKLVNILTGKYKNKKWNKLKREEKEEIAKNFYAFEFIPTGFKSYDRAQITSGGLDLNEINLNTFETKKVKDLYCIGELLDLHGDCGGYNLTLAFLSGILLGENIC